MSRRTDPPTAPGAANQAPKTRAPLGRAASPGVRLAMLTAILALAHQVGAKSVREGIFLSTYASASLPKAMFGSALCSIPAALLVGRAMARWGPQRIAPLLFAGSGLLWLVEWLLLPSARSAVAALLFLHVSVGGALLVSAFWSVVSERFDPHALKTYVTRIGAAATFGGLLGGALMERTSRLLDARSALLTLAGICLAASLLVHRLCRKRGGSPEDSAPPEATPHFTPYLRNTALLVACAALAGTFTDFALKNAAASHFERAEDLVRFFALFYTGSSLVGFLLQALIAPRLLTTLGIGATLSATPLGVLLLGCAAALSPSILMLGTLKAAESALSSSLFRSAYEPLFTPLAPTAKRKAKSLIDVVFDKGGDALGGLLVMMISLGGLSYVTRAPPILAAAAAAAALHFALQAQRGYVAELESRLRSGTLSVEPGELSDPASKLALSATAIGLDQNKLLEEIRRLTEADSQGQGQSSQLADQADRLASDVRTLLGANWAAIERVLESPNLDARLAAFIVPLLGVRALARPAAEALRRLGPPAVALMSEAMLSDQAPLVVRRRIPHVLRTLKGDQVVEALTHALAAHEFSVRARAALALREVLGAETPHPDPARILRLAVQETARVPLDTQTSDHIFTLLALGTGRQTLELVRQGLRSHDQKLRGTALEYLESLLPDNVRSAIVSALESDAAERPEVSRPEVSRPENVLREELRRSLRGTERMPRLEEEDLD